MTVPTATGVKGFRPEAVFRPRGIAVIGADRPAGGRVLANLREGGFAGRVVARDALSVGQALPDDATLDLAVVDAPGPALPAIFAALAGAGTRAAIIPGPAENLAELARNAGIRALGPYSFGVAVPALGLNATLGHLPVPRGGIALLTQSASLARAVLDWAGPNGVGFSTILGVGGNADLGFATPLDWLSRDPGTGLILLDLRRVREPRRFLSAARAAARLRPVVALYPGERSTTQGGPAAPVLEAALHRAGVFSVPSLESFLSAAETFARARPARGECAAIVTNGLGPGRLAADACQAAGITLARLPAPASASLAAALPVDYANGTVYADSASPTLVAEIAAMLSAAPEIGGVLVVLAPTGMGDDAAIEAVIAAAGATRIPVLTCALGETTGARHRRRLAEAGLPAFATPEQAVTAFAHLLRERAARAAARELPPARVLSFAPDHGLAAAALGRGDALSLLAAYGIPAGDAAGPALRVSVADDALFGPAITIESPQGGATDLPPLNLPLATCLAGRAELTGPVAERAAACLVSVSQLIVEERSLATLTIGRLALGEGGPTAAEAAMTLRPPGEMSRLSLPTYPEHLASVWESGGEVFDIRPIRPEDAAAHVALIRRVSPEDLRYRFFTAVRDLPNEQIVRLTEIDYDREMAFIAVRRADGATVGVARLVSEGGGEGEFAVLVAAEMKGRGLGTALMSRLIDWARSQRIARVTGHILAENRPMLGFVTSLGFSTQRSPDDPDIVEAVLTLAPKREAAPETRAAPEDTQ